MIWYDFRCSTVSRMHVCRYVYRQHTWAVDWNRPDIGGVGFAMLLLLIITNSKKISSILPEDYSKGINFWKAMFIPVIIAMSASQNVVSALSEGWLALVAGLVVVVVCLLLVPVFNLFSPKGEENRPYNTARSYGIWRTYGNNKRHQRRPCSNRPRTCTLRRNDGYLLYRSWLPALPVGASCDSKSYFLSFV